MQKSSLAITIVSLLSCASSYAQNSSDIETYTVTANRFEQSLDSLTLPVTVIDKEEIASMQAKSLSEVLRRLPGVQISGNGGYGQTQSVYVRGGESDHTLFLIDGVRVGSATSGSAAIAAIPLVAIERIEYIRGSRGAVYGSDAISGVINIITKNSRSETMLLLGGGSDSFKQGQAGIARQVNDDLHFSLAGNVSETDGFSVTNNVGDKDDDGFESRDVIGTVNYNVNKQVSIDLQALYHEGEVEYDPADNHKDEKIYNIASSVNYQGDKLESKLQLAVNRDHQKNYSSFGGTFQTDRKTAALLNQYHITEALSIGGGADWYEDDVSESSTKYNETSRDNLALYVSSFYNVEAYQLEAALRTDDNQRYGRNNTWQLGAGWKFAPSYRLSANAGTGFKAPTFNDLYHPFGSNPNLVPEESKSYELALESKYELISWRIAGYVNKVDNMLAWNPTTNATENIGKVEIKGIEISSTFDIGNFSNSVSLDLMDPQDKDNNRQLARRAKQSAKWNLTYFADKWQADVSYLYQGKRYDYPFGTGPVKLDPYSLIELAGSYFITDELTARARVANLLDEEYTVANGYNTQERSYFASLEYRF